jgi:hypothetical protein
VLSTGSRRTQTLTDFLDLDQGDITLGLVEQPKAYRQDHPNLEEA